MIDKTSILVVDDEEGICMLLKENLSVYGCDVEVAYDGIDAVDKLHNQRFDVVLLDIRMPLMDGLEVLKIIRQYNLAEKVIMLSGVDEMKLAQDSLKYGADDFMSKPYDLTNLLSCIDRVLQE